MSAPATLVATASGCEALTVMFDGACPLCRREVGVYQALEPLEPVAWLDVSDVSQTSADMSPEDRARYLARFHVQLPNGKLLSGAAAFVALWQTMPGWRWLGRFGTLPGVTPLLEALYSGFLHVRPNIQRLVRTLDTAHLPSDMIGDLRSDHAGETGAVWIYKGMLFVSRDEKVRAFANHHLQTESEHLALMSALLPPLRRSWLLIPWRVAGFVTGALPALLGQRTVFATIAAVETFVGIHYQQQIDALEQRPEHAALRQVLIDCQSDEHAHRDEAKAYLRQPPRGMLALWCAAIGRGSAVAVTLARKL